MISGPATSRTIPELLSRAASRDPDGSWLRADAADWAGPSPVPDGAAGQVPGAAPPAALTF
ncbi:MAG: hypothetical protein ACLPKW_21305, partial [Acetobacteraceae bacterium]